MNPRIPLLSIALASFASLGYGQIPPGYYNSVDTTNAATLRQTLHPVIDDHQRYPYTSGGTDTWDILELAQQDPSAPSRIVDVYENSSYAKVGGGNLQYNREHTWPKSYGFPIDGGTNYPYTDCHVLFLCNSSYNSSRGNRPFDVCSSCLERPTVLNNGEGGGSGAYVGNSNWTLGTSGLGQWETWVGRRGDVARAMLYMDVRYEGGTHSSNGASEPNLILTDDMILVGSSNTGSNLSVAYMGRLSVLLQWHAEDPVDDFERNGHEVIYGFQGNRNPFIDHPEWADCLWGGVCPPPIGDPLALCFGDGSGTPCPCGNTGNPGHGCTNSVSPIGSVLFYSGTNSISAQDMVLLVGESVPNTPGLFFSGQNSVNGGMGVVFGDGLRCAGGQIRRLEVVVAGFFGESNTSVTLSTAEALLPGDTRYYQWWYRDTAPLPCGNPFNTSNALEVTWLP
ncbi:MAG: endonuclease I [Candidatus Paceibacteria bacterium]|jgi:endonuclease I